MKFFQSIHGSEVIGLSFILMLSCGPAGNHIHAADRVSHCGFCDGGGLHNGEARVTFVFHPIVVSVVFSCLVGQFESAGKAGIRFISA